MLLKNKQIASKKDFIEFCRRDFTAYDGNYGRLYNPFSETGKPISHVWLLRKTEYHMNMSHRIRGILFKFWLRQFQQKYSLMIPVNCFDKGFRIQHLGPVLSSDAVSVGENCLMNIYTGQCMTGGKRNCPIEIGHNVYIGIGTTVLGGVHIADDVVTGVNSVVTKSILEENITVAGSPAKKISDKGRREWKK